MLTDAAHKKWWQIGEVVFGVPLLAAIILQHVAPLSFINLKFATALSIIGIILCVTGIALVVATRRIFSKYGQPTDPGLPTRSVLTTGIFSLSRNPMYLGAICFLIGTALIFKLTWVFILLVPTLIACRSILIEPEEQYLAAKFGVGYQRYKDSVSRWIGRSKRWKRAEHR